LNGRWLPASLTKLRDAGCNGGGIPLGFRWVVSRVGGLADTGLVGSLADARVTGATGFTELPRDSPIHDSINSHFIPCSP
jgi:hypothetical protein